LENYDHLRKGIMELQEESQDWNDAGNEQLINVFDNLNQVELQVR